MKPLVILSFLCSLLFHASAAEPAATTRVQFTGHSFAGAGWLEVLAKQAGITGYENLGKQSLGASRVIDHWKLADARNTAKAALIKGGVDVLTLSPNMTMPDEGIDLFVGFAWYRAWFFPNKNFFIKHERDLFRESVSVTVRGLVGAHEVFVNGQKIGAGGAMPPQFESGRENNHRHKKRERPRRGGSRSHRRAGGRKAFAETWA